MFVIVNRLQEQCAQLTWHSPAIDSCVQRARWYHRTMAREGTLSGATYVAKQIHRMLMTGSSESPHATLHIIDSLSCASFLLTGWYRDMLSYRLLRM